MIDETEYFRDKEKQDILSALTIIESLLCSFSNADSPSADSLDDREEAESVSSLTELIVTLRKTLSTTVSSNCTFIFISLFL